MIYRRTDAAMRLVDRVARQNNIAIKDARVAARLADLIRGNTLTHIVAERIIDSIMTLNATSSIIAELRFIIEKYEKEE